MKRSDRARQRQRQSNELEEGSETCAPAIMEKKTTIVRGGKKLKKEKK